MTLLPAYQIRYQNFFNLGGDSGLAKWLIWIFIALALFCFFFLKNKKKKQWQKGRNFSSAHKSFKLKYKTIFQKTFFSKKMFNHPLVGFIHALMFFGILGLILKEFILGLDIYIAKQFFDVHFLYGNAYQTWLFFSDLFRLQILVAIFILAIRRYQVKPSQLENNKKDGLVLLLIFSLPFTGFLKEGFRIAVLELPFYEKFAFISFGFASIFNGIPLVTKEILHLVFLFVNFSLVLTFIALSSQEKLGHALYSLIKIRNSNLNNESTATKYLIQQTLTKYKHKKIKSIYDLPANEICDVDLCVSCGRCQTNCPAFLTDQDFSPKKLINNLKEASKRPTTPLTEIISKKALSTCTLCASCEESCPLGVNFLQKIVELRKSTYQKTISQPIKQEEESSISEDGFNINIHLLENDQPTAISAEYNEKSAEIIKEAISYKNKEREKYSWLTALGVQTIEKNSQVDYCFFVGCLATTDERYRESSSALIRLLQKAGLKIGFLGSEQVCCGNFQLTAGHEEEFQQLALQNISTFNKYGITKIICNCPHGYNTLKKEYADLAQNSQILKDNYLYDLKIYSHLEILHQLLKEDKLSFQQQTNEIVVYQDPCLYGRYNNLYEEPRQLLKAIPGIHLTATEYNKKKSLCCGFQNPEILTTTTQQEEIKLFKTRDLHFSGATTVVTSCPYCTKAIQQGINKQKIKNIKTIEISNFLLDNI